MVIQILDHITDEIKQIRIDVFMKEQGFTEEFDEIDETAKFVLLSIDGKAAGTCRYFPSDVVGDAHIGRMAVRKLYRGQHLGTKIMMAQKMLFVGMDIKHVPCLHRYRLSHSMNPLAIKRKGRNTLMKGVLIF